MYGNGTKASTSFLIIVLLREKDLLSGEPLSGRVLSYAHLLHLVHYVTKLVRLRLTSHLNVKIEGEGHCDDEIKTWKQDQESLTRMKKLYFYYFRNKA
jgi:hypothetical protein